MFDKIVIKGKIEKLPERILEANFGCRYTDMVISLRNTNIVVVLTKTQAEEIISCCNIGDEITIDGHSVSEKFIATRIMYD